MKTERVKELITELNNLDWNENLDSTYQCLVEIDYLLYKYRDENEYIKNTTDNIIKFYLEPDYIKKRYIFNWIKASCNILNRYIL